MKYTLVMYINLKVAKHQLEYNLKLL